MFLFIYNLKYGILEITKLEVKLFWHMSWPKDKIQKQILSMPANNFV